MSNGMSYGMPGPGGSLGWCAVCGDSFAAGVIKSLMGGESGIIQFSINAIEGTLYCHSGICKDALDEAFGAGVPTIEQVAAVLPEGPLKKALTSAEVQS